MDFQIAQAEETGIPVLLVEVPLLFEMDLKNRFDMVIAVIAGAELCVKRLMKRDNVSRDDAETFLKYQLPDDYKANLADFIIKNDGDSDQMKKAVECFYREHIQKHLKGIENT
jgi:dephospho-CoA kinase